MLNSIKRPQGYLPQHADGVVQQAAFSAQQPAVAVVDVCAQTDAAAMPSAATALVIHHVRFTHDLLL